MYTGKTCKTTGHSHKSGAHTQLKRERKSFNKSKVNEGLQADAIKLY